MLLFHEKKLFEIDNKPFLKFQKQLQSFNLGLDSSPVESLNNNNQSNPVERLKRVNT
jgi:hypothetical protein